MHPTNSALLETSLPDGISQNKHGKPIFFFKYEGGGGELRQNEKHTDTPTGREAGRQTDRQDERKKEGKLKNERKDVQFSSVQGGAPKPPGKAIKTRTNE